MPEYTPWQASKAPQADLYPQYGPPGIGNFPRAPAASAYRYNYPQPEPVYRYQSQVQRPARNNYYAPPRNSEWRSYQYEGGSQYYSNVPPGLHGMNVPRYSHANYSVTGPDYRPRAASAPYNAFLENFKQKLTYAKKIDIEELKGHMLELAKDQFGSRHLQQRIQGGMESERKAIYGELRDSLNGLMTDAFGNYVVQMFIQYTKGPDCSEIIEEVIRNAKRLAFDMYGCRCVQKALEIGNTEQRSAIISVIRECVAMCVESQNANHVLQKCIECLDAGQISFLLEYAKSNVVKMSCHMYGCRIMQRIVEKSTIPDAEGIIDEIIKRAVELSQDQFGNYVVQHVLEHGKAVHKDRVIKELREQLVILSKQKFSSNVIEKCFQFAEAKSRDLLLVVMLGKDSDTYSFIIKVGIHRCTRCCGTSSRTMWCRRPWKSQDRRCRTPSSRGSSPFPTPTTIVSSLLYLAQHVFNAVSRLSHVAYQGQDYAPYMK
eukprot:TRINITY_DN1467_c0_g1_i10.p1 TRINITY_DN1467_c0_g1~~TRINITY_DN1467_c0_g1_i10.p1  ORF type:complete len:488 (-),score=104.26 TRINITY_DN1467_c0_g1_i10:1373-2836(-)